MFAPAEPKPPFHGLDRAAPRISEVNVGSNGYILVLPSLRVEWQANIGTFPCFAINSSGMPGLLQRLEIETHDLGQIEVAAPGKNIQTDRPGEEFSSGLTRVLVHRSPLVESAPGDVTASAKQDKRENHLAEGRTNHQPRRGRLFNHGQLPGHGVPLG